MHRKLLLSWMTAFLAATAWPAVVNGSWHSSEPGFKTLDVTSGPNNTLWSCGTDASIASSTDGGIHWELRDQTKDRGVLLSIRFRGSFGYATGTTGFIAFTSDNGKTWRHSSIPYNDVLSASFSDTTHGLLETRSSVLATVDGKNWSSISDQHSAEFTKYPFVLGLAALDGKHMAIHISEAPPSSSGFLYTEDAGATWKLAEIPNTTITSLLVEGEKYWAVGNEVIHKDRPGGGYAVPLLLYSMDGEHWDHSTHDIQICHWEGCGGRCTRQGCLAASGLVLSVFDETATRTTFPPNPDMNLKWAIGADSICFAGERLQCAPTKVDPKADPQELDGPGPSVRGQRLATSTPTGAVQCIACGMESIYVDPKASGRYSLKVTLLIDKNGLVKEAEIHDPPSPSLRDSLHRSMMDWVFLPILTDGIPVDVKLNTSVTVMAVRPR